MSRSVKKGPYVDAKLMKKVEHQIRMGGGDAIRTWARACTVIPDFISRTFLVHNGNKFMKVYVTEDMVGHKLGEFAPTRTFRAHGGKAARAEGAGAQAAEATTE